MSETEIAQLNERVAVAMGYQLNPNYNVERWWHPRTHYSEDLPPDFYRDIRLCGEMAEWLVKQGRYQIYADRLGWMYQRDDHSVPSVHDDTLPAALCRAIDAVAKGNP